MNLKSFLDLNWSLNSIPGNPFQLNDEPWGPRIEGLEQGAKFERNPKIPPNQCNAIFLGCSWVNGGGISYEQMFSSVLCKKLEADYGVKWFNWNLSMGGGMVELASRMLLCTVDVIKPDLVFFVIPGMDRRLYFRPDGKAYVYAHAHGHIFEANLLEHENVKKHAEMLIANRDIVESLYALTSSYEDLSHFLTHYKLMELTLENRGIPWAFSIVPSQPNIEIFESLKSKGWINTDHYLGEYWNTIDTCAPNDTHPGPRSNAQFARVILNWFKERYDGRFQTRAEEIKKLQTTQAA